MDVYLVRHAIADTRDATRWPEDAKRPLTQETKDQQSPFMGQCRCEQCGYVTSAEAAREALRESRSK